MKNIESWPAWPECRSRICDRDQLPPPPPLLLPQTIWLLNPVKQRYVVPQL
jgi:hypothetical protein